LTLYVTYGTYIFVAPDTYSGYCI